MAAGLSSHMHWVCETCINPSSHANKLNFTCIAQVQWWCNITQNMHHVMVHITSILQVNLCTALMGSHEMTACYLQKQHQWFRLHTKILYFVFLHGAREAINHILKFYDSLVSYFKSTSEPQATPTKIFGPINRDISFMSPFCDASVYKV